MILANRIEALINQSALSKNLSLVRKCAPASKVMAVVKADSYGLGVQHTVSALGDADAFAVKHVIEAQKLRDLGVSKEIVLLQGCLSLSELQRAKEIECSIVIHNDDTLSLVEKAGGAWPAQVWLKVDTGMHRLGVELGQTTTFLARCEKLSPAALGLMTHFACADEAAHPHFAVQADRFKELVSTTGLPATASNSAATIKYPDLALDWVRPGIMLYGGSPFGTTDTANIAPVVSVSAPVLNVRRIDAGEAVGYGCDWTADRRCQIAVIGIGYADGYPRHARNGTPVWLGGKRAALVGRVSMDMICVRLDEHVSEVSVGDRAELWGEHVLIDEVAECATTISYELLTRMNTPRMSYKVVS